MRLFFATFLSQENVAAYQALVDRLMSDAPDALRPIPPASHHLTLAFLGELSDDDVENCRAGFTAVTELAAFSFSLEPPRILMGRGRPRLICVDVGVGTKQVSEAQAALVAHLRQEPSLAQGSAKAAARQSCEIQEECPPFRGSENRRGDGQALRQLPCLGGSVRGDSPGQELVDPCGPDLRDRAESPTANRSMNPTSPFSESRL